MDAKSVTIYFVILCIVKCSEIEKSLSNSTLDTSASRISSSYEKFPEQRDDFSEESDRKSKPPDHAIPTSEHENPEEPPTSPKKNPTGGLVIPKKVNLDFVPTKLYAQVRKTNTVKHLPREEAVKSATNREEALAAPRLREIVKKSKSNVIYTEEGYEDAAYDHAGHIRDADFHEGYARKLDDEKKSKKNTKKKLRGSEDESEEKTSEESENKNKSDDFEDDYRDDDSETRNSKNSNDYQENKTAREVNDLLERSSIDPKRFTENEIEKLEGDLEREYEEAEKNTEDEVPENLTHVHGEDSSEEDTSESNNENAVTDRESSEKVSEGISDSESEKSELRDKKAKSSFLDYGKVFWDYFKNINNDNKPLATSESDGKKNILEEPGVSTDRDSSSFFNFTTPPNFFSTSIASDSNSLTNDPSISSSYESWRRQDDNSGENSEESVENASSNPDVHQEHEDENKKSESENEGSTTVIGPKKLSYTVIIRSREKPTTESRACDRQVYTTPGERSVEKSVSGLEPEVTKEETRDISFANDFTVIQPPLPAPLGQVTYADFPPESYSSHDRPSVTPQIEIPREEAANNGERDLYGFAMSPHTNRGRFSHSRPHRAKKRLPRVLYPITKLVPPSPINRSKYSDYFGLRRRNPFRRADNLMNIDPWSDVMRFYRSFERNIFGRKKRSVSRNNRMADSDRKKLIKNINSHESSEKNDEEILHEPPRVVDKIINDEIETRFKDDSSEESEEENSYRDESREENNSDEETNKKIEIEVPDFDFSEVLSNKDKKPSKPDVPVTKSSLDLEKYPFYENSKIRSPALKYMTNPRMVPRKTFGGTEFYDSRDRYRECVEPGLEQSSVLPEKEEPAGDHAERGSEPRLSGLGEKLDCFRAKYFDEDPLDNPLFLEERVGQPRMPDELASRRIAREKLAMDLIGDRTDEDYRIIGRNSRKPETNGQEANEIKKLRNREEKNQGATREKNLSRNQENQSKRKKNPRTTTKSPELLTHQRQVYEDVMGTIKNLANFHENNANDHPGIQTVLNPPSIENPSKFRDVLITERPITLSEDLLPPSPAEVSNFHRYRFFPYRTNRVSYRLRARTERSPSNDGVNVAFYRTVKVHKRSIDENDKSNSTFLEENSKEVIPNIFKTRKIRAAMRNVTESPKETKRDLVASPSERIVYTIRDRIRHSKPKGIVGRHGKAEVSATDPRRREPRYNKNHTKNSTDSDDEIYSRDSSSVEKSTVRNDYHIEPGELYKIQFSTTRGQKVNPENFQRTNEKNDKGENAEDEEEERNKEESGDEGEEEESRENSDDDFETPSPLTESPQFVKLRKYLESDPPGYKENSDESSSRSSRKEKDYGVSETKSEPSEGSEKETENEDDSSKSVPDSEERENSNAESEEVEGRNAESRDMKNNSNEDKNESGEEKSDSREKKESSEEKAYEVSEEHDSEKEFIHFASRPYSPFESNEDPKYAHLGPRLSKPHFHHPSFSSVTSGRKKYSRHSDESEEGAGPRYVFPWENDKSEEASGESRVFRRFHRHEYPWERRERLARERERHRELYGFSAESDEDASETRSVTRVYPLKRSSPKTARKKIRGKLSDNEQGGSEQKPRYSSRYRNNTTKENEPAARVSKLRETERSLELKKIDPPITTSKTFRRQNFRTSTTTATPSTIPSRRKARIWPSTTPRTTTKPPSIFRRRKNRLDETSTGAASEKKEIVQDNSSTLSTNLRKNMRRPAIDYSKKNPTRPPRRKFEKSESPKTLSNDENNKNKKNESSTTPKSKTIEHRSRFSKEEIITKTSYPNMKNSDESENEGESDGTSERESVKKVSITTKETPEIIYRTEEIDKDGVKGMLVSIRRNNGTSSPFDDEEDLFANEDKFESSEEEDESSTSLIDSHVLANRLMQTPPYVPNFDLDENSTEKDLLEETHRRIDDKSLPNYIKDPDRRLYYFVED